MFKQLLTLAAAACISLGASADVLWQSEEGVLVDWGQPCYKMTPAEFEAAGIAAGDYLEMTINAVDPDNTWPQVALFGQNGGWPPLCNSGVGKQTYPLVVSFPVTYDLYTSFKADGVSFSGNGAYVNKVELKKGEVEVGPFTVWFGNKACDWGNGVTIPAAKFADVEANGQLIFWTSDQSFQILLGGWSGLNLPSYAAAGIPNMEYEDGVTTLTLIEEYETTNEYDQDGTMKEFDVFALMKANGVVMHGTTTLYRIDYIPGAPINEYNADVEKVNELANALQEFNNEVAETFPGYAVLKADEIAALTAQIEALNDKIATAWEAFAETGEYVGLDAEETMAATEALMALIAGQEELAAAIEDEYNQDVENLNTLTMGLQEFNNEVAENFPGYAVLKAEEIAALTAQIEALNDKLNGALEAAFETGVYEGPTQEEMLAAYNAFQALNTGLDETVAAITEEYEADVEYLNEITTALQELNNQVAEELPGYAVLKADEFAALTAQIEALNNQINAAMEAAYETGVYEGPSQEEMLAAYNAFQALNTGLEETVAAITEESEADVEYINEIVTALQELNSAIEENFPGFGNLHADELAALNAAVEALNDAVTAGLEAAYETGVYEGPAQADIVEASESLMSLAAEFEVAAEAIEDAINEDYAILEELNDTLGAIIDDEEFPAFLYAYGDEIGAAADALNTVNDAFFTAYMTALYETGVYEGPSQEDITNATQLVMGVVTARAEALAAIENAAEEDMNTINAYYEMILGVLDAEGNEDTASYQIAQLMNERLAELKEAVIAAQAEALNETAEYVSPITDADTAYLEGLAQAFQTTSIYGIGLDANGAIYFDLNGNMTQNPVAGKVYIKIADGKATKTLVK